MLVVLLGPIGGSTPEVITARTPTARPSPRAQAPKLRSRSARSMAVVVEPGDLIATFDPSGPESLVPTLIAQLRLPASSGSA